MPANAKSILKRFDRMKAEHQLWEPLWQEIAEYIHPRRSNFTTQRTQGAKQTEKLFDSTALDAHDRLASTLNGTLTSRAIAWFSLTLHDETLNRNSLVKSWLEECSKRVFAALNQSNFAQEIHEVYLDEPAFGTSGIFLEERNPQKRTFDGFVFRSIPLADLFIDEDAEGRVNTVFRTFKLSAGAAVEKWGKKSMDPNGKIMRAIEQDKPDTMFTFLHAIYPRNDSSPRQGTSSRNLPWASCYVCIEEKGQEKPIAEGGFQEFPCMVPRWSKTSGEKYGRGIGHLALPDIKTLNKIKQLTLKSLAKSVDPPTMSEVDGIEGSGKINNTPGGNTVVRNSERSLMPLYPAGTFREAIGNEQIKSQELVAAIKRYFYADMTELPDKSYMTAFEVGKQFELLQRKLGPVMGRQETELLNPLIDRMFGIMLRHDALPEIPQVLLQLGPNIDVQYEGPLAKSQRLSQIEGLERFQQWLAGAAQLHPDVLDVQNFDEAARIYADVAGVPSKVMNDPDDVQQVRDDRAKQLVEQQKKADMEMAAGAAGKAAPALKLMAGDQSAAA